MIKVGGVILFCLIVGVFIYFTSQRTNPRNFKSKTFEVTLTSKGYEPSSLKIKKGDKVVFKSNTGKAHWPASNLHPTHDIYSEFDPKEPIEADKSWSFTFNKVGVWKFHDHLSSSYRGSITVEEENDERKEKRSEISIERCRESEAGLKKQCFEELIEEVLTSEGLDKAFDVFATLYASDVTFASDCHDYAHKLGDKSYEVFSKGEGVTLSTKSSYCGYGFYHGFMEKLLKSTGDIQEAQEFCKYAGEQLSAETSDAEGACYHGIGHGAVEDVTDTSLYGDPQAIINPSIKICEMVSANDQSKLFRCITGVYNALEIVMTEGKYNLSLNPNDPLWFCKTQPNLYKEACYTQMVVVLKRLFGTDFDRSMYFINLIPEDEYAIPTMQSLAVERVRLKNTYDKDIQFCRNLSLRFKAPCISAVAEGYMKYGPPQEEYKEALSFCADDLLYETEKKQCFDRILSILRIWYTKEKASAICNSVQQDYRRNSCVY